MPGISGIVSYRQAENLPDVLEQMLLPIHRQVGHTVNSSVAPPGALGSVSFSFQDTLIQDDNLALALVGEIVDQQRLRSKLSSSGHSKAFQYSFPKVLIDLYRQSGPRSLCGLNGIYAIAIWDANRERLTIINDRYGIQKLYYWQSKDQFLFASEYKSISWHPDFNKKISEAALSDLISVGYMLDNRTLFEDIQIIPPANILTLENGRLSFETYWDYQFNDEPQKIPVNEYVDQMAHFTQQAVSRRVHDDTCLLVTGGLDSRTITGMYEQCAPGQHIIANTLGRAESFDVIEGRKLAKKLGYEHFVIPLDSTYLSKYAEACTWLTEGNMNCYASWILAENPFLVEHNIQYAVDGIGGEVVSGRFWSIKQMDKNVDRVMDLFFRKNDFSLAAKLMRPSIYKNVEGETFNAFRRKLDQVKDRHPFNQLDYMTFHQDFRRHATSIDVMGDYAVVLDPFLDNDLVDFALKIPPELRATGFIMKRMIRKHIPQLDGIGRPIENTTFSPAVKLRHPTLWNFYDRGYNRIKRVFSKPKRANGDSLENYILPNTWMRTGSKEYILGVLSKTDLLEDYFNMDEVNRLVSAHMEGRANEFEAVGALLTFALWRQLFCSPDSTLLPLSPGLTKEVR